MVKQLLNKISSFFEKDIADEFRERLTNPFFVALFFSWFIWNWELLFMLFNFEDATTLWEKTSCIKEYIEADKGKWRLFWNPIFCSLGTIILFSILRQISLVINLFVLNRIQPFLYKLVGSSNIVSKERFEKVTKKVSKLRDAYETMVEDVNNMSEENQALRTSIIKTNEKADTYKDHLDELQEKSDLLNKNSLDQVFEGRWLNQYIFPSGTKGEVVAEVKEGTKYFEKGKYVFNLDMIEVNTEASTIKFRKVGLGKDSRKVVNDLKIISDTEYRGIEDVNTIIIYTRVDQPGSNLLFTPYYTKDKITIGERTNINFAFSNNGNISLEILSYQFSSYFNGMHYATNERYEDRYTIPGGTKKEIPFGEVNPLEYYFSNKKEVGVYDSEIKIEYRIDGTTDVLSLTRIARLVVSDGIIIRLAKYGTTEKFAIVTDVIQKFIQNNKLEFRVDNATIVGLKPEDDPHYGHLKRLEIFYSINGIEKTITATESATIKIE